MSFEKDTCFLLEEIIFASRNYIFFYIHYFFRTQTVVIACSHLEDFTEIPDITPIRSQNLPDYMTETSEGEAFKKCISLLDQLN